MRIQGVVGVAIHGGWAIAVSVADQGDGPIVVDRRRLTLAVPGLPDHPYHHEALALGLAEAEALVLRVREAITEQARCELRTLRDELPSLELVTLAVRESRPLPAVFAEILASRAVYFADSEMYRDAVHNAALDLGLQVVLHPRDKEFEFAADAIGTNASEVALRIRNWRKTLGPPWQKDHHAAAAAAIGALATGPPSNTSRRASGQ